MIGFWEERICPNFLFAEKSIVERIYLVQCWLVTTTLEVLNRVCVPNLGKMALLLVWPVVSHSYLTWCSLRDRIMVGVWHLWLVDVSLLMCMGISPEYNDLWLRRGMKPITTTKSEEV